MHFKSVRAIPNAFQIAPPISNRGPDPGIIPGSSHFRGGGFRYGAQAKDSNRPITPPVSAELQSDLSFDPLTPVTRIFSSPPASTDWTPTTISPLSGSCHPSKPITIVEDREFVIKASLWNAHWSMMSYTGTSRVDLVEIGFDIVSSVPSDSPLPPLLSSKSSPASDFIRGPRLPSPRSRY
ncbi:BZ3500_MvSof-1268-A1-R1_Chr11-3g03537 [Microbotryum saponariae]|uniref:BZ3500_MvSof-1268-A1-R1_Chr11-3g03537 protein n=1 Tax=Microbotryum saponariae TaxID=289078 RepID=A0A2X0NE01_9BASI|nr:BZ3500_MvSof-1268-A1-R1_Chr11-3g03537 [Microbotryum saponariae]SDA03546.1 BZ3501_MvSof-1269-A2-R1_Chr11g03114 [Microbotryum saponariae]